MKVGTISAWFCVGCGLALAAVVVGTVAVDQLSSHASQSTTGIAMVEASWVASPSPSSLPPQPDPNFTPSTSADASLLRGEPCLPHESEALVPPPPPSPPLPSVAQRPSSRGEWGPDDARLPANANQTLSFDPDEPRLPEASEGALAWIVGATWDPNSAALPSGPAKPLAWDPNDARLP